jgi:hypothetical protein
MSSVRNDFNPEAKITYMSTVPFNNDFWSYSLTWNQSAGNYIGTLSAVSGATSGTCPARRFLHETGKKLFPSANPGIKTMLVGVYDPVSFLNGYIDPNSEVFLRMNNDRAANIDTLNPADNEANLRSIHGEFALRPGVDSIDYGQPVYTRGNVVALGSATITSNITSVTGAVQAETSVTAVTGNITAQAGNLVSSNGGLLIPTRTGTFDFSNATDTGAFFKKYIGPFSFNLAGATVLTQLTGINSIYNIVSVEEVGTTSNNYFRVVTPDAGVGINNCSYSYVIIDA